MSTVAEYVVDAGVLFMCGVAAKIAYFDHDMQALGVGIFAVGATYAVELLFDLVGD